jgi:hypothetical protein
VTTRIRYLKPDFFLDEDVAALPPLVRLFYQGLWCHADREGRIEDRAKRLKVEIMPYENGFDVDDALEILAKPKTISGRPFIVRYEVGGQRYLQILTWARHQRPHPNEKASEIPPPPRDTIAMYDKGQTRVLHKKDKRPTHEHGDGDLNGDLNGDGNGECERKGKIDPPAPIQGSGSAEDAEPSHPTTISPQKVLEVISFTGRKLGNPKKRTPCGEKDWQDTMTKLEEKQKREVKS